MKRVVWLLYVPVIMKFSNAQVLRKPVAASYTGMGAYSLNHVDAFSFTSNQASLAQVKNTIAGVYTEKKFFLDALNDCHAAAAITTSAGNFGVKLRCYGFSAYKETQIGLAHARKLDNQLDVGIQFNYNAISIAGYGTASAIDAECGSVLHINEQLHTGIHINAGLRQAQPDMPTVITAGIGYEASSLFFISGEIIKEEDQPVNVNVGLQYQFVPQLMIRAGVSAATSSVWMGAGLLWKTFRLDVVSSYHPQLGFTPGLAIFFIDKKRNTDDTDKY